MNKKQKTLNIKQEFLGFESIVSRFKFKISSSAGGQVMIIALVFLAVVLIIASSLFTRVADFIRFGSTSVMKEQATSLAEAGVDYATQKLNDTAGSYAGDTQTLSTGQTVISLEDDTPSLKTITVTGYVPNTTNPRAKRTVKVQAGVGGENIAFHYAVQVGIGGIIMQNDATIYGTVYSNKPGTNSIQGSNSSKIEGHAWAVGTISSPDPEVNCFDIPCKHPNSPESEMPTLNYQEWKDDATDGGIINCAITPSLCDLDNTTTTIGPKQYLGNLTISNGSFVTMDGPVYVTGNIEIKNDFTKLKLNNSFGSTGTILITDGTFVVQNEAKIEPTNADPKGYIMAVSTSINSTAVNIKNEGVNALFYALEGGAELQNEAKVTSLVAKQLTMKNDATLTYDSGLADARFTSGPGCSWQIKKGTYKFTSSP